MSGEHPYRVAPLCSIMPTKRFLVELVVAHAQQVTATGVVHQVGKHIHVDTATAVELPAIGTRSMRPVGAADLPEISALLEIPLVTLDQIHASCAGFDFWSMLADHLAINSDSTHRLTLLVGRLLGYLP